jgi:hypothetical protein
MVQYSWRHGVRNYVVQSPSEPRGYFYRSNPQGTLGKVRPSPLTAASQDPLPSRPAARTSTVPFLHFHEQHL